MNTLHFVQKWTLYTLCVTATIASIPSSWAEDFEALSATASSDYKRKKQPDGILRPETYAFGKGGYSSGPMSDPSIDRLDFMDVAQAVASPLAGQNYLPAKDFKTTNLLIMVYWGTTHAPEDASESNAHERANQASKDLNDADRVLQDAMNQQNNAKGTDPQVRAAKEMKAQADDALSASIAAVQAENRMRDTVDRQNAQLLGYDSLWARTFDAQNGTARALARQSMLDELEERRYFVVLMAYDFQLLLKEKKHKLVWETRMSIRQHDNRFDKQLPEMLIEASKYFGQNTNGLIRTSPAVGNVEVGVVKSLGVVPEK